MNDIGKTAIESSAGSSLEASSALSRRFAPSVGQENQWQLIKHDGIASLPAEWDAFVPLDVPHLRSGMLRAAQEGKVVQGLTPVLVNRRQEARLLGEAGLLEPVAAALFYTLPIDTLASAPEWVQRLAAWVRQRAPGFLWKSMRVCGSPISNSSSGLCLSPALSADERREIVALIVEQLVAGAR